MQYSIHVLELISNLESFREICEELEKNINRVSLQENIKEIVKFAESIQAGHWLRMGATRWIYDDSELDDCEEIELMYQLLVDLGYMKKQTRDDDWRYPLTIKKEYIAGLKEMRDAV